MAKANRLETLESIFDTHPDIIARYDADLNFTYLNPAAANFYSGERDTMLGQPLLDYSLSESNTALLKEFNSVRPDHDATAIQPVSRPDGTQYILWTTKGLYDGEKLIGYQSTGRDVTTEHWLSRQLDETQRELRGVLDAVPAFIWYKDDKNNILRLNQSAADSMGMRVEDVEGRNTYELFGDAAKSYHEADLKVFNSGKALIGLIEPFTPDGGESGWVQTDKLLLDTGAGEPRLLVVSTDITALKEQEAVLKSINKNLDDFASMVSHDLQAPLRRISISAELMQMELGDTLPATSAPYFEEIATGVTRMRTLIRSFLKFMRASPGSVELEPLDLSGVLDNAADDHAESLADVSGTIILPKGPFPVRGDRDLLRQVFANLIGNAVKYRHPDRPIQINIEARKDKQYLIVTVADTGMGIDPDQTEHIFDLFGRAKPHAGTEGSGIGLALCRRILALHGGSIELVESGAEGSRFELKLFRSGESTDG